MPARTNLNFMTRWKKLSHFHGALKCVEIFDREGTMNTGGELKGSRETHRAFGSTAAPRAEVRAAQTTSPIVSE